jgi:SAM-dependent methyltransferase
VRIYEASTEQLLASQQRDPLLRHITDVILSAAASASQAMPAPGRPTRVIDVGCGVGRTSIALARAGFDVVGVDPEARAVALAEGTARELGLSESNARFLEADAMATPAPELSGRFDLAVCSEVIEHVGDPSKVLLYCRDVLRPGGVLILTTPHDRSQWTVMDDYAGHVTRFAVEELQSLLVAADFELDDLGTEGFPFQRLVMRSYDRLLRARGGQHEFDSFGTGAPYRLYVALMPWLLRFDHRLRHLRRGTTLVAVARRKKLVA